MLRVSELRLPLDHDHDTLVKAVARRLQVPRPALGEVRIFRRAIDARGKEGVQFSYTIDAEVPEKLVARSLRGRGVTETPDTTYVGMDGINQAPSSPLRPVVVGAGPCGLFAALMLARAGRKPILLERGEAAGPRARKVTGFWRRGMEFDPKSNVQYGEGGAGTFSDGKLYTQIRDPEHRIRWLLHEMVKFGAPEDILVKARPHIGTDRLITVLRGIRDELLELGAEIRFESQVVNLEIDQGAVRGLHLADGSQIETDTVVMAPGHSARDTFQMLADLGVSMEQKPFSLGVRIEHPQSLVDKAQFGDSAGHEKLGAAAYKVAWHARNGGRSAYSFCMCPGGLVVAAASEEGGVVTNGMSSYARAEANANSGFMVGVKPEDYAGYGDGPNDPLAGVAFQRHWERKAFAAGGSNYHAPAQLVRDFLKDRPSTEGGKVKPSYEPGVEWGDLRDCLPDFVAKTLKSAIHPLSRRLRNYDLPDAVLTGVETRSSAPVRVARHELTMESPTLQGLFPAGEGAGYAGGIISAAADGMKVAEAILHNR